MVAAHSRVRGVRNGVLEVVVDSPGWATEFRYLESDLVARASRLVGEGVVRGRPGHGRGTPGAGGAGDANRAEAAPDSPGPGLARLVGWIPLDLASDLGFCCCRTPADAPGTDA